MSRVALVALLFAAPTAFAADVEQFMAAQSKWQTIQAKSYSFIYEWRGAVVVAPACADARILVRVVPGVQTAPTVVRGSPRCRRGLRGERAIGLTIPRTIEAAFKEMSRYVLTPPVKATVTASYDEATGAPLAYYVEKLEIEDNDEGFNISNLKIEK